MSCDDTRYSDRIAGVPGNYGQSVRFDSTGGYLGISQEETQLGDKIVLHRVLLSPWQVRALKKWLGC